MKKWLIILLIVLGVLGITFYVIIPLMATPVVLDTIDDAKKSAAISEANLIINSVNNFCAAADMKEQINGTFNICSDGVTIEEVSTMTDLSYAEIVSIKYDSQVTDLVIKSQGLTVTYDYDATGVKYTVTK